MIDDGIEHLKAKFVLSLRDVNGQYYDHGVFQSGSDRVDIFYEAKESISLPKEAQDRLLEDHPDIFSKYCVISKGNPRFSLKRREK